MTATKDFQVDHRVRIALDAMDQKDKIAVQQVIGDKEVFVAHEQQKGAIRKLPNSQGLFVMNAGPGLRVVYSKHGDQIVVQDLMRKTTADRYLLKRRSKGAAVRKPGRKFKHVAGVDKATKS